MKMYSIIGGLLIEATGVKKNPVVLIEDDKISKVGSSKDLKVPSNVEVISRKTI